MNNSEHDKLELKIVIDWARGIVAEGSVGIRGHAEALGAAFCVLDRGIKNPSRETLLQEAPDWLKDKWPQYYGKQSE
jgi:hypothetical protein